MRQIDQPGTKSEAQALVDRLLAKGLKASLQTLKHAGMSHLETDDAIRGYSVSVELKANDPRIQWATGRGFRCAPKSPAGFAWTGWHEPENRISLCPYPGNTLVEYESKLIQMLLTDSVEDSLSAMSI